MSCLNNTLKLKLNLSLNSIATVLASQSEDSETEARSNDSPTSSQSPLSGGANSQDLTVHTLQRLLTMYTSVCSLTLSFQSFYDPLHLASTESMLGQH